MGGVYIFGGLPHLLICDVLIVESDVAGNGPLEEKHVLLHLTDGTSQLLFTDRSDIYTVDGDASLLNVVVPADQI